MPNDMMRMAGDGPDCQWNSASKKQARGAKCCSDATRQGCHGWLHEICSGRLGRPPALPLIDRPSFVLPLPPRSHRQSLSKTYMPCSRSYGLCKWLQSRLQTSLLGMVPSHATYCISGNLSLIRLTGWNECPAGSPTNDARVHTRSRQRRARMAITIVTAVIGRALNEPNSETLKQSPVHRYQSRCIWNQRN